MDERRAYEGGVVSDLRRTPEEQAEIERRIKAEKTRLKRLLRDVGKERLRGVDKLLSRAAFQAITLEDLEDQMNREGCEVEYQNGANQWGTKQSPAVQSYASLMQRYLATMRQLLDLLPESAAPPKTGDAVLDYINGR